MTDVLFPEYPPPMPRKSGAEFKATPDHKRVLEVLERRGPKDEEELAEILVSQGVKAVASRVPKLVDELAKAGHVADTGQRAEKWRKGRRLIVWRWVKAAQ